MDLKKYKEEAIKTLQEIIRIKTVEDVAVPQGPFGKGNKECLEKVLQIAENLGFKTKNLDGYCGYAEIGEGDELFAIIGHLDVVPEGDGWKYPPYSGTIADDELWGRGTWDDKGPIIIALYALKALADSDFSFNKRVRIIFGCNEESGSKCMEHYLKVEGQIDYGFSPDANFPVIFAEKSITNVFIEGKSVEKGTVQLQNFHAGIVINAVPDLCRFTLKYGCDHCKKSAIETLEKRFHDDGIRYDYQDENGQLHYTVYGKACHGSIPQYGINAASYALKALKEVTDSDFVRFYHRYIGTEYNGKSLNCYEKDEYGDIAVNVGIVSYDHGNYQIQINSRLPFTMTPKQQYERIKEQVKHEDCVVLLKSASNGFKMDQNCDMIQYLMKAYQEVTGDHQSKPLCIAGGTYAREFQNCVAFGPEMEGFGELLIHQPNERIPLKAIDVIMEIYVKAIAYLTEHVSFRK